VEPGLVPRPAQAETQEPETRIAKTARMSSDAHNPPGPPGAQAITARYLTRFRCLGGACEDTCCQGWQIPIDRRQYAILEEAMRAQPAELEAGVELEPAAARSEQQHAHLRMTASGACSFLSAEKLCTIQLRHGQRALPAVCATYPRLVARAGPRLEVWGSLSCPELARQCLLPEDAVDVVAAPPEVTPRWEPARVLPDEPSPYDRHLDDVRAAGLALLALRQYPVSTRLFLLAYLGKETVGFFRKDAAAVDSPQLAAVIAQVQAPGTVARWHQELGALPRPRALTANLVGQLVATQDQVQVASFRRLVTDVLAGYGAPGPAALWAEHARRRDRWEALAPGRLDRYFENYARNFWLREWHTTAIDLLAHARRLLVRVAVLRFLLVGHPALAQVEALADEQRRERLDAAAVEVFYKFSRAVEHQGSFLERIAATVVEEGLQTFAHSAFLTLV
jgi:lysine-N-methylase